MKSLAAIVSVGARTAIGLDAIQTGFLYRAGIAGMTEAAILDLNDEPYTMALQPTLDPLLVGPGRAVQLGLPALDEALASLGEAAARLRIKIVVCVDEHLAVKRADGIVPASVVTSLILAHVRKTAPLALVETHARGAATPGFVLSTPLEELSTGVLDAVILGGLHTDYDVALLRALEEQGRLYSPENLDAFIPGEAAAFAVLMRPDAARRFGLTPLGTLHAIATAFEKARPDNDDSAFEALGLTVAVRKLGATLGEDKIKAGWVLTDLTFEMRRVYEWMAMVSRSSKYIGEPNHLDSPAQRLGHLGAAAIPLHLVLAAEAWRRGYAPADVAISFAGSDAGERSALLLSAATV